MYIVVLGSSTSAGKNLDVAIYGGRDGGLVDRWADRLQNHLTATRPGSVVENLGKPGYATSSVLPSGTPVSATYPPMNGLPDPMRNITYALSRSPDAIIVNIPFNRELTDGVPLDAIIDNLHVIQNVAADAGVEVWVTTSNPPESTVAQSIVTAVQASNVRVMQEFGDRAIDFFTVRALPSGYANPMYTLINDSHPNAEGHRLLFEQVVAAEIPRTVLP